eukprot:c20010_g1_i1 orf=220-396(+)
MAGPQRYINLKLKNFALAAGLTAFVASVYTYTLRAVGGTDELEAAVKQFEKEKVVRES